MTTVYHKPGYDLILTGQRMFVGFPDPPAIDDRPFHIGRVAVLTPGDRFTAIGNDRKRSAGWTSFEFTAPGFVEFVGSVSDDRTQTLLFNQWKRPGERIRGPIEFAAFYFALYAIGDDLLTITEARASRIVPAYFVKQ